MQLKPPWSAQFKKPQSHFSEPSTTPFPHTAAELASVGTEFTGRNKQAQTKQFIDLSEHKYH
jgi:hypothetical protein